MEKLSDQKAFYPTAEQLKERLYQYLQDRPVAPGYHAGTRGRTEILPHQYLYLTENPSWYCLSSSPPVFVQSEARLSSTWVLLK